MGARNGVEKWKRFCFNCPFVPWNKKSNGENASNYKQENKRHAKQGNQSKKACRCVDFQTELNCRKKEVYWAKGKARVDRELEKGHPCSFFFFFFCNDDKREHCERKLLVVILTLFFCFTPLFAIESHWYVCLFHSQLNLSALNI